MALCRETFRKRLNQNAKYTLLPLHYHSGRAGLLFFFFQAEDGIRDDLVLEFRRVLFRSTHDMGVIAETCDRVAVMYSGRIAEIGPVQEVVRNPLHPYAKGLMGAIPTLAGEDKRLVQIPGSMPRLSAIPPGCPFNPRCAFAFDRCCVERPEPIRQGTQSVACHLFAPAKETAA